MTMDFAGQEFLRALLDSFHEPLLFADCGHVIRYCNRAARQFYPDGERLLGRSLLACHNAASQQQIRAVLEQMKTGLNEQLISDSAKRRIYMRAVRDDDGILLGYYERFAPPRSGMNQERAGGEE